jgi:alkaline phosphatase
MDFFDQPSETDSDISLIELAHQNDIGVISNLEPPDRNNSRVLGIFAKEHLPVMMTSSVYPPADYIRREGGLNILPDVYSCMGNPQFSNTPRLSEMTKYALDYLDQSQGFFMMIESASIDKQAHDRNACGSIGELGQLEETLALILDFATTHEQTYIIVTADHSHAAQVIPDIDSVAEFISPGQIARLRLPNDNLITINYATSDEPESEEHTGSMVPVFSYQIELPAMMRQSDVFPILKEIIISYP